MTNGAGSLHCQNPPVAALVLEAPYSVHAELDLRNDLAGGDQYSTSTEPIPASSPFT